MAQLGWHSIELSVPVPRAPSAPQELQAMSCMTRGVADVCERGRTLGRRLAQVVTFADRAGRGVLVGRIR